ncbi:malectin domain-containing carbohydrate-binding protein [Catalinimonas alkaloidigena]|uniref:malectin domain-containing carbohydrate-binding protein n=1 Tax=Catalinimonas alkaloidigena TaxID=1075417 RepID=UPI00240654B4|nr:malectin domain-containing carbohydrate-binding protein [Catalinimonas alkaloidigena]
MLLSASNSFAQKPNVIVILADDMGFSDLSSYGSEIQTPNLDALADNGIKFRRFYNTAKCSPTRASLLTGQYPHAAGMENLTTSGSGNSPAYLGYLSPETVTIAEVLKSEGYGTYMSGKWHVGENSAHWPTERGFDNYWGLISGANSYYELLTENGRQMALGSQSWNPATDYTSADQLRHGRDGFYMTDATTDFAIDFLNDHQSTRTSDPFFLYLSFTAPHWPLHAYESDIAAYDGVYDDGWDNIRNARLQNMVTKGIIAPGTQLSARDGKAWSSISDDNGSNDDDLDKADYTRRMQVYAAQVSRMDQAIGKLVQYLKDNGTYDNTLIMFMSDNGGSAEDVSGRNNHDDSKLIGEQGSYLSYLKEWSNASNTPFRKHKNETEEGGIATPLIVHWPDGIQNNGIITDQIGHVKDIMPTVLEAAGSTHAYPTNYNGNIIKPLAGESFAQIFDDPAQVEAREIFWEYSGERAVRHGKWKIQSNSGNGSWSLYNIEEDPTELNNISSSYPAIVNNLAARYEIWETSVGHQSGTLPDPSNAPSVANPLQDLAFAEGGTFTFQVPVNAFADDANDHLTYHATLSDGSNLPAWLIFEPLEQIFTGNPQAGELSEALSIKVSATDWNGNTASDEFLISQGALEPFAGCLTLSPLACNEVVIENTSLPYVLNFDGSTTDGLEDGNGNVIGFTMIDPPSVPLFAPSDSNVPGYEPSNLSLSSGSLTVTTTAGIAYRNPSQSNNTNSQVNTLGIGLQSISEPLNVKTTLINPPSGSGKSEQAGLWFGLNEDNFFKLVLVSTSSGSEIALRREVNALSVNSDQLQASIANVSGSTVTLRLYIDPLASTAEAFYAIDGQEEESLGILAVPASFISGTDHDGKFSQNVTFTGLFATHRNGTNALSYSFDDFSVSLTSGNQAPVTLNPIEGPVILEEGAALSYTFPENTFEDLEDGSGLTYSASLADDSALPSWLSFDGLSRTFTASEGTTVSGIYEIKITATDSEALSNSTNFILNVSSGSFTLVEEFDYAEGALEAVSQWVPGGGNGGSATIVAQEGKIPDRFTNQKGGEFTSGSGNAAFNYNTGGDDNYFDQPYPIQKDVPFYYAVDFMVEDFNNLPSGNAYRSFIELSKDGDLGNTESVRLRILNEENQLKAAVALASGSSSPNDYTEDASTGTGHQWVIKAVWDGNQINYSAALDPPLNEGDVSWNPVGSHSANSTSLEFVRLFAGTSANNASSSGIFQAIRISTAYNEVVKAGSNPPFLLSALTDQGPFEASAAFSFSFSDVFGEIDSETLTYTAQLQGGQPLPAWLGFNAVANTLIFSASEGLSTEHTYQIVITATDQNNLSAADDFQLQISTAPPLTSSQVLYREVFGNNNTEVNPGNNVPEPIDPLTEAGWNNYEGANAQLITLFGRQDPQPKAAISGFNGKPSNLDNVNAGATPDQKQGFLFANIPSDRWFAYTEEFSINLDSYENIQFSWHQGHASASNTTYLVIKVNDVWYVHNDGKTNTAISSASNFNTDAELKTIAFSASAEDWKVLEFVEGSNLSVGDTPASDIPLGQLSALGLYSASVNGGLRIDAFQIEGEEIEITNMPPSINEATFEIQEDAQVGDFLGQVEASDADEDVLTFEIISGNAGDVFAIDDEGNITVAASLDFDVSSSYILTVEVNDGTVAAEADITVNITEYVAPLSIKVNFQDEATTPPAGYLKDYGQAFGDRGNNFSYGWKKVSDDQPHDITSPQNGSGRNRLGGGYAGATDQQKVEGTLVHVQGNHIGNWAGQARGTEVYWELEIPNGVYEVKLGAGDYSTGQDPEVHTFNVEGTTIISTHVPEGSGFERLTHNTFVVEVNDGALTINALGGVNSKINYVEITETTQAPLVPATFTFDPTPLQVEVESGESTVANTSLGVSTGNPSVGMIINSSTDGGWLSLPEIPAVGNIEFIISAASLAAGDHLNSEVITTAVGFTPLVLDINVNVLSTPPIALPYRMNVGGSDYNKEGDIYVVENINYLVENASTTVSDSEYELGGGDADLYYPRRFGADFGYNLPIANGTYTVALHMAENFFGEPGARVFDVLIEDEVKVDDLDLVDSYGKGVVAIETFTVEVTDNELNIQFISTVNNGIIQAIEILELQEANSPPVFVNASFEFNISENANIADEVGTVIAEDSDEGQTLSYSISAGNTNEVFAINNLGIITLAGALEFATNSQYTLTINVTDDGEPTASASTDVIINVEEFLTENSLPLTSDKTLDTDEDTALTFEADDFPFSDTDEGDALIAIKVSQPTAGSLIYDANEIVSDTEIYLANIGLLSFMPEANANGEDYTSFSFAVSDGKSYSEFSTMSINVTAQNDAPEVEVSLGNIAILVNEYTSFEVPLETFSDIDGDELDYSLGSGSPEWVTLVFGELIIANPEDEDLGVHNVELMATDEEGLWTTDIFTFTVKNTLNAYPTSEDITVTIDEDEVYTFASTDFVFVDEDEGDELAEITVSPVSAGSLTFNGTEITEETVILHEEISDLSFTPEQNANGDSYASFSFSVSDGKNYSDAAYTFTFNLTEVYDAPVVVNMIPDQSATAGTLFEYIIAENTFADADGEFTLTASLEDDTALPVWLTFVEGTFNGTPAEVGIWMVKVTASDGIEVVSDVFELAVIEEVEACSPISTLACEDIAVTLPLNLDFGADAGQLLDGNGTGTGFTMVLEHSEARRDGDLAISNPEVNGYEPALLTVNTTSGQLDILSQAGIAYLDPPASSNNNNQVNTLGVGLQNLLGTFRISTSLKGITTGTGSAQAGLWFGIDEDNFAKLVITDDDIELRVEREGASGNNLPDQIKANATGASGADVLLELEADPVTNAVTAFYTINEGTRTELGTLTVPTNFFNGRTLYEGSELSFAGIFATHRNGTQFTASFDEFSVESLMEPVLTFTPKTLEFSVEEGGLTSALASTLVASEGDPLITLSEDPEANWLILPENTSIGNLSFGIDAEGLVPDVYTTSVFAIAEGYVSAELIVTLEVTESATEPLVIQVNFQDEASTPPPGYLKDDGQPYGMKVTPEGYDYGWLTVDGQSGLDLTANGRNRDRVGIDLLLNTIIHMQYGHTGGGNGNLTEGIWEIGVPNGEYQVTVTVGDEPGGNNAYDSQHSINVEGVSAISQFQGASAKEYETATVVVNVQDSALTLDAAGGTNTKINSVLIESLSAGSLLPRVLSVIPADGSTNIALNTNISANDLYLPNANEIGNYGVDNNSITNSTVKLFKDADNTEIPSNVGGTGGGDAINLTPAIPLEANTTYRFEIDGVTDLTGIAFEAFSSTFTTGSGSSVGAGDLDQVAFTKAGTVASGAGYTSLTIGPDGKFYGLAIGGEVHRWIIEADGTLSNKETFDVLIQKYGARSAVGFTFDPDATAENLIAYISHCSGGLNNAPEWDGKISRLSGLNLETEELIVTNLPRSKKDHLTNSIAFRPGEPNVLYFNQGSNSAGGAPDNAWGNRLERLLSAAVLRLDLDKLPSSEWPLDAMTTMNAQAINSVDVSSPSLDGMYNPYHTDAPLTLYATGVRNAYDLVWHSNGQLYVPTNGTAAGANSPASIEGTRRPDGTFYDHNIYPQIPAVNGNKVQRDWLFRIDPNASIGYYGHPNPLRGEFVLNRGDADTDDAVYNGVLPDPNYRGAAFDFEFNKSPNGVIEYKSNAENGNLTGSLLVVRYSGGSDIIALVPDGTNGDIGTSKAGIPGFTNLSGPLDLVEDVNTGNIYVSEYGANKITLIRPSNQAAPKPVIALSPEKIVTDGITGSGAGENYTVFISNNGNAELNDISVNLTGADASEFTIDQSSLPNALAAGASASIKVAFNPDSNGPKFASIEVSGTDAESKQTSLSGLGKQGTGGSNEPSLQWILDTYGIAVNAGDQNPATNLINLANGLTYNSLLGDEVSIQKFERASDAPVTLEVLSVYGPESSNPIVGFGWYQAGLANALNELFTVQNTVSGNGQTLTPNLNGSLTFDPGLEAFGFYNYWPFFNNRTLYSEDALNTFSGAIPHHIRVYPLPGEANAYVIATEEHVSGFDYQDIVVIARNIRPADSTPPVAEAIRINAGGTLAYTDSQSNTWQLDGQYLTGSSEISSKTFDVQGTEEDLLFLEYRFAQAGTDGVGLPFGYQMPVESTEPVTVNLYFVEPFFGVPGTSGANQGGTGNRVFSVNIEGGQGTLTDFDMNAEVVTPGTAIIRTFENITVTDGSLNIDFTSSVNNAIISAIEVIGADDKPVLACSPISTLACEEIIQTLPFVLNFTGAEGGIENTGFTMVDPPSARLSADGTISNPQVPGFDPARLSLSSGTLQIDAAKGLAFARNGSGEGFSDEVNSQINTMGVGFNANAGSFSLQTTIINPYSDASNNFEQAGLWFGLDEDNYVKLVVRNAGIIELRAEENGLTPDATQIMLEDLDVIHNSNVTLRLLINPAELTLTAFYALNDGREVEMGTMPLYASLINGANVDGQEVSFGGVFASKRRENANVPVVYSFEDFSITPEEITEPFFTGVNPADGATGVALNSFQIVVGLLTPDGYELDKATLSGNVKLIKDNGPNDQVEVPANVNDTGGGDAIILTPIDRLDPLSEYIFRVDGVEANLIGDLNDRMSFTPFESRFTTGTDDDTNPTADLAGVSFTQVKGAALGEGIEDRFSSLVIGPDGKLYGSTTSEVIKRWDINADGSLSNLQILTPELNGAPHPSDGARDNNNRLIIGLTFAPEATADNLIAYVTHSALTLSDGPEWDGMISQLSGPDLATVKDVVIHLPRSLKDHLTNSIIFGPDGDIYLSQGSNTAGGKPDAAWGFRPERLLAGAVLKLDLDLLDENSWPLDAYTTDNISVINNAPANSIRMTDGTYNPYATSSPLTIFSTGVRNAYDLVWHTNGWLYVPTNGTAGNNSSSPNTPASADYAPVRRPDGTLFTDTSIPGVNGGETQKDWLFKSFKGSYHGHPNPLRGEFVLNHGGISYSGLPGQQESAYTDVAKYPNDLGPDPDYVEPAFDFGKNKSPNGAIEYKSNAFGGAMKGLLLVTRFSGQDDIIVLQPGNNSGDVIEAYEDVPGLQGLDDPLEIVEDINTGNIYMAQYDRDGSVNQQLVLLRADDQASPVAQLAVEPGELVFETTVNNEGNQTDEQELTVTNQGTAELSINSISIGGAFASQFSLSGAGSITLQPGESTVYTLTYQPDLNQNDLGYQEASLILESNDGESESINVGLHALKKSGFEGNQEPPLQAVVDALGIGINVGWTSLSNGTAPAPEGEEVIAPLFVKAGAGNISIEPVGRYSPAEELPFGWYTNIEGSVTTHEVGILADGIDEAQTLYPAVSSGSTEFNPQGAYFGIFVESNSFGRFNYTEDAINTGGVAHRTRIYPVKDRDGNVEANSYLVCFEDATNGDYQDYMFVLSNVKPYEEGSLLLTLNPASLNFIVGTGGEALAQTVTLSANSGIAGDNVNLTASESWVVLPDEVIVGSPMAFNVNVADLAEGNYTATVTASSPGYVGAGMDINLSVRDEIVWTYQFNFQDGSVSSPEGYVDDTGLPFGTKTVGGESLSFGWVEAGTTTPADATANTRNRGVSGVGGLENTLNIINHQNSPLQYPPRDWMIELPNGLYYVNVSVGDPGTDDDSNHEVEVNGVTIVTFDEAVNGPLGTHTAEGTEIVEVTDGILILTQGTGGSNTKVNYVRLSPVDGSTLPPSIFAELEGNAFAENVYRGRVSISLQAADNSNSGGIASLTYELDSQGVQTYNEAIVVDEVGEHTLVVVAEDNNGNVTEEIFSLTVEAASGALLAIENMTKVPGTDRGFPADDYYTFHRLGSPGQALVHDANVMRVHNTGTAALVISDIIIPDITEFVFEILPEGEAPTALPITIAPGESRDINLTFIGTTGTGSNGIFTQPISFTTNADNAQDVSATLHGAYSPQPEGGDEINAQKVFDAFGFQTSMLSYVNDEGEVTATPTTNPSSNFPLPANIDGGYEGDLILSSTFVQADPEQPVIGIQLSALHGGPGSNGAKLVEVNGSGTVGGINFNHNQFWYQTLLPRKADNSGNINFDAANTINQPFRINVSGETTSGKNGGSLLGVRVYRVIDHNGNVIPNEYIVLQDFIGNGCGAGSANCDWNDNTFYFINIRPEAVPFALPIDDAVATANQPFTFDLSGFFNNGYPGNKILYTANISQTLEALPDWLVLDENTGVLSGTPPFNAKSSYEIAVTITDYNGLDASETFTLNVEGAVPQLLASTPESVDYGIIETETSSSETISIANIGEAGYPTVNISSLQITGEDAADFEIEQTGIDTQLASGESASITVNFVPMTSGDKEATLVVNNDYSEKPLLIPLTGVANLVPVAVAQNLTTEEDTPLNIALSGTDADDNELSYTIIDVPSFGTLSGEAPNLTYTPDAELNDESESGSDSFTFQVNDGYESSAPATITISVTPVNDEPFFDLSANATTNTSLEEQTVFGWAFNIDDGDSEVEQALSFDLETNAPELFTSTGQPVVNVETGDLIYTPVTNLSGTAQLVLTLNDGQAVNNTFSRNFSINVNPGGGPIDADGDGFTNDVDCNDGNADIYPGAPEICDGVDNNCNGVIDEGCGADLTAIRINTGGPAITMDGKEFQADQYFAGSNKTSSRTDLTNLNGTVYQTERSADSNNGSFSYAIPVAGESNQYQIALHMAEIWFGTPGGAPIGGGSPRLFDVFIEGEKVLDNYNIYAEAGNASATGVVFALQNPVTVNDGVLNIFFTSATGEGGTNRPSIGGIEVIEYVEPNEAPTAVASADPTTGFADLSVTLDGSASSDTDGEIVNYNWSEGGTVLYNGTNAVTQVELGVGVHVLTLTVTDDDGAIATDEVTITVEEAPDVFSAIRINAGGGQINAFGETFVADQYFNGNGKSYANTNITSIAGTSFDELYLTERSTLQNLQSFAYNIPVTTGTYLVRLHFAEIYFGATSGGAGGAGKRIFSVSAEGNAIPGLSNYDIIADVGSMTAVVKEVEIQVSDGTLNLNFSASVNQPKLSAIEVLGLTASNELPVASAGTDQEVVAGQSGLAQVELNGNGSFDDDGTIESYVWSEGGVQLATGVNPKVNLAVGIHTLQLTVTDNDGSTASDVVVITVEEAPEETSALRINAGGPSLNLNGDSFTADASINPAYHNSDHTYQNTSLNAPALYQTERGSETNGGILSYNIPVPNGTYTIRTHHAELYYGYNGPTAQAGQRVFDIFVEGNLVQNDLDLFAEGVGPGAAQQKYLVLEFEDIEVTDGVLTMLMDASVNRPTVAAIEVIGLTVSNELPFASAGSNQEAVAGQSGFATIQLDGSASSDSDGIIESYVWTEGGIQIATGINPTVDLPAGIHTLLLTVTDDDGGTATDVVVVSVEESPGCGPLPADWTATYIGGGNSSGEACYSAGEFEITASGSDIWGTSDEFRYVYQPLACDGEIIVQLSELEGVDSWAKAGVMIRESTAANAKHAMIVVTPGQGINFQYRVNTGGNMSFSNTPGSAPEWLRIVREGSVFTGYYRESTSQQWTELGSIEISMGSNVLIGMALTAHDNNAVASAQFSNIEVNTLCDEPSALTPEEVWLEAECANELGNQWSVVADDIASGDAYVVKLSGSSLAAAPEGQTAILKYNFSVQQTGAYYLFARVKATSFVNDSFWVRVNGGNWIQWWQGMTISNNFAWNEVAGAPFNLNSGDNTIEFAYREDGTQLDKLHLNTSGVQPGGLGGAATNACFANEVAALKLAEGDKGLVLTEADLREQIDEIPIMVGTYPNPFMDYMTVEFNQALQGEVSIMISSMTGSIIMDEKIMMNGETAIALDLSTLASEAYILRISHDQFVVDRKIMKQ